jgi:hypothetical protein
VEVTRLGLFWEKTLHSPAFYFGGHALRREVTHVFFVRLESDLRFTFLLPFLQSLREI